MLLFKKIFLLLLITIVPLALFNYAVDPLQCFRPASWYKPLFDPNERVQSGCLARSYSYDTVIIGSSHVENVYISEVDKIFKVKSIRLAIAASTAYEQNKVLNLALNTRQVKNVIWGLDTNILFDEPNRVRDDIVPFPSYIYNRTWYNNIVFLLDPYFIKHYTKMVVQKFTGAFPQLVHLETLNSWENNFTFSKERAWQAYQAVKEGKMAAMQNTNEKLAVTDLNNLTTENVDRNVIKLIKNNPNVHFYIYFPPYSILRFVELYKNDRAKLEAEWKLKKYLISGLLVYKNVSIFDFQVVEGITHNLDNYKDLSHYAGSIDKQILTDIKSGHHQLKNWNDSVSPNILLKQIQKYISSNKEKQF